ncbi:MAG: Dyp-type peroxidase [Bacteroidia bacterium]|nr:Dyp-type peroxidase [Bacteroidia bacterium]
MELNDIQGLLIRGHSDMPEAAYLMLSITQPEEARAWLRSQLDNINHSGVKPADKRLHLAFTFSGLEKLGAGQFLERGFSVEFVQGMSTDYKSRVLGDLEESAPENWQWGGPKNEAIDLVWMIFAPDKTTLASILAENAAVLPASGIKLITTLDTQGNPHNREHFGFRDGIAQPIIDGLPKKGTAENTVAAGEFIFGYENGYNQLPESPLVKSASDPNNLLPVDPKGSGLKDLGRNGSYMVFRQLVQDVPGFWETTASAVKNENPDATVEDCIFLASKMVGRWPNGHPITLSPTEEKPYSKEEDDFLYAEKDPHGFGCPLGSHIRRANPRDAMPDNKPKGSVKISNRHRILRRGRSFGPPFAESFDPRDLMKAEDDGQLRGLQFICFNTNIQRQFEFVQHQWSNNTKFAGLYSDPDPILGIKDSRDKHDTHDFTIQAEPVRRKIQGLRRHVEVIGGAYFFMPGLQALRFLAQFNPSTL